MPVARLDHVAHHLRRLAGRPDAGSCTDAELLQRFVACRDEAAFTTLVSRYGRLIGAVCRHVLRRAEDVEDAVQATLLVLARKADSVRKGASVASWLYGVAHRTALTAKRTAARRQARERRPARRPAEQPVSEAALHELQAILDEEVLCLPESYRAPFVLCCLEGKSKAEAARELGWKEGTVSGRLALARRRLRGRLARRGVALSAASCAVALDAHAGFAVPAAVVAGVLRFLAGQPAAVPAAVVALSEGVFRALPAAKAKLLAAVVLALGLLTAGAGVLARHTPPARPPGKGPTGKPAEQAGVQRTGPAGEQPVRTDRFGDALPAGALRRLGTLHFRHGGGQINALLLSADGKTLVSNTHYGSRTVCAWELATGKLLHEFPGHYEENRAVALSPDGKTLATGQAALIRFWDLASGREVRKLKAPLDDVQGLAFSPDGKALASGHGGQAVLLWDLAAAAAVARLPAKHNRLTLLAFTPDGKTLVTGDTLDRTIRLFDVPTRKERCQLTRPEVVRGFALSPDGNLLALGSQEGPVSVWDVKTGKLVRELRGAPFVAGVAFSPDGSTLASAEWDQKTDRNAVALWDVATGKQLRRLEKNVGSVGSVHFSADGKTLIAGTGGAIRLWDAATGEERGPAAGNPAYVADVAVSPDGRTLAYVADTSIRLWDLAADREVGRLAGHHWSLAFSPDGKTLAGGTGVNQVNLWDVAGRGLARRLECDPKKDGFDWVAYYHVAFSPDGKRLASAGRALLPGGRNTDEVVQLWDLAAGKRLHRLTMKDHPNEFCTVEAVAFAPDGKTLVASGRGADESTKVRVWQVDTGQLLAPLSAALNNLADNGPPQGESFPRGPIIGPRVAVSPDGKMLAMNRRQATIPLWEAASGTQRCLLRGHEASTVCVAFSPDGRTLASAGCDNTIRLWNLETGTELRKLTGHRGVANSLAFSPDGRMLISAADDTTILLWDAAAVTCRPRPRGVRLSAPEGEALWKDLADRDAAKAYRAITRLTAAPEQAVAILQAHLEPARPADGERVAQLIRGLEDRRFAVRAQATRELEQLAEGAQAALRDALQGRPSVELRRRAEALLDKLASVSGERLRLLRAVEVLERGGTPGAQQLLERLAAGSPAARLTQEARASLARLAWCPAVAP
jgi:RNA polymerase sigma factor (sigma-70 family)